MHDIALARRDESRDIAAARALNRKVIKIALPQIHEGAVLVLRRPSVLDPTHWTVLRDTGTWDQVDARLTPKIEQLVAWFGPRQADDDPHGLLSAHDFVAHATLDAK